MAGFPRWRSGRFLTTKTLQKRLGICSPITLGMLLWVQINAVERTCTTGKPRVVPGLVVGKNKTLGQLCQRAGVETMSQLDQRRRPKIPAEAPVVTEGQAVLNARSQCHGRRVLGTQLTPILTLSIVDTFHRQRKRTSISLIANQQLLHHIHDWHMSRRATCKAGPSTLPDGSGQRSYGGKPQEREPFTDTSSAQFQQFPQAGPVGRARINLERDSHECSLEHERRRNRYPCGTVPGRR